MARQDLYPQRRDSYWYLTHRPLQCLLFLLPLLVVFHLGEFFWQNDLLAPRDIYAVMRYFGVTMAYLPAAIVIGMLLIQHIFRHDPWEVRPLVLTGMLGESVLAVLPLFALGRIMGKMLMQAMAAQADPAAAGMTQQLVTDVGAAVYEEFIFRMVMIGAILFIFVDVFNLDKDVMGTIAVLVSAAIFSLYHFPIDQLNGEMTFPWKEFTFRALAGAYLGVLYVVRGLGVAAGAHALFNVSITLLSR